MQATVVIECLPFNANSKEKKIETPNTSNDTMLSLKFQLAFLLNCFVPQFMWLVGLHARRFTSRTRRSWKNYGIEMLEIHE